MTTVISLAKDILAAEKGTTSDAVATQTASTNDAMRTVNVPRGECCDSAENRCRKCPAYLPSWLIGITIGVAVLVLAVVVGMVRCIYVWHNCRGTAGQRPSPQGAIAMQRRQNDNHESVNGPTVGGFGQTPQSTERQEVASPSQIVPQCAIPPPGNEMHVRDAPHVAPVPALSSDPLRLMNHYLETVKDNLYNVPNALFVVAGVPNDLLLGIDVLTCVLVQNVEI